LTQLGRERRIGLILLWGLKMHSAIIVVRMPEQHHSSAANQAWLAFLAGVDKLSSAKVDPLEKQQGVERLAENVWMVNFHQNPAALARVIEAAVVMKLVYKILQLDAVPQWLPVDSNPKPS
jgi:hypothetical protein